MGINLTNQGYIGSNVLKPKCIRETKSRFMFIRNAPI